MNKTFFRALLLCLSVSLLSCTNNNNPDSSNPHPVNQQLVSVQGDGTFGEIEFGTSKVKTLVFKNNSTESISLSPSVSGPQASDFNQTYVLGCSSVLPGKSCLIKILFSALNKVEGFYEATLTVGDQVISLSASVPYVPEVTYKFYLNNQLIQSGDELIPLSGKEVRLYTVKVQNSSPKIGGVSSLTMSNSRFQIIHSTCDNVILKPNATCLAKIVVTGNNTAGALTNQLIFDGISLSTTVNSEVQDLSANLTAMNAVVEMGDFYTEGTSKIQLFSVINNGKSAGSILSSSLTLPPEYSIISNNCSNVRPGAKCFIRLVFINPSEAKGAYSDEIEIGGTPVTVTHNMVNRANDLSIINVTVNENIPVNSCSSLQIEELDNQNISFITSAPQTIISNNSLFEDSNCQTPAILTIEPFESSRSLYIKNEVAGLNTVQIKIGSVTTYKDVFFYAPLVLSPNKGSVVTGSSVSFSPAGGKSPFSYEVISGSGNMNSSSFNSVSMGLSVVKVTDSLGQTSQGQILTCDADYEPDLNTLTCIPHELYITNGCSSVNYQSTCQLTPNGGVPPYNWGTTGGSIGTSGLFTATCNGSINSVITLTDSIGQSSSFNVTQSCWPLGLDGNLNLATGNYEIQVVSNKLKVVNMDTSASVLNNVGEYVNAGAVQETCKLDLNNLNIPVGSNLKVSSTCKWLILGVKNTPVINGNFSANQLISGGNFTTQVPDNLGALTSNSLSLSITQKNGAVGGTGGNSSSGGIGGNGGSSVCGNGSGGGGGGGVNNYNKTIYDWIGTTSSTYTVPARVTAVKLKAWGGGGGGGNGSYAGSTRYPGGGAGFVQGIAAVSTGNILATIVAQGGQVSNVGWGGGIAGTGGWPGGAAGGGEGNYNGGGGGGYSGVFKNNNPGSPTDALIIAGAGGGGANSNNDAYGNPGGGLLGTEVGSYSGGRSGTQTAAGAGFCSLQCSSSGSQFAGGEASRGTAAGPYRMYGGGGGAGWWGGAGGAIVGSYNLSSGGSGSSYYGGPGVSNGYTEPGVNYSGAAGGSGDVDYASGIGIGRTANIGGFGRVVIAVEGSTGESGIASTCSVTGTGGLGSVNFGGNGGVGGSKGKHGQGIYIKTWGGISGSGIISVAGTNGVNGSAGTSGGTGGGYTFGNGGTGGGGAGGTGGKLIILSHGTLDSSINLQTNGGLAGSGGTGAQNGDNGSVQLSNF